MGSTDNQSPDALERAISTINRISDRCEAMLRVSSRDLNLSRLCSDVAITLRQLADELAELRERVRNPDIDDPLRVEPAPGTPGGALNVLTLVIS